MPSPRDRLQHRQMRRLRLMKPGEQTVHDPHAAILGAARLLRAAGGLTDKREALYHYNPSRAYIDAVERYARRIHRSERAFLQYYARPLVVRTATGYRLLR